MTFSYFPGCTLKTKAKRLDECARASARALGVTLEELPEWQCCGGVYPMAKDEIATRLASVRALSAAARRGQDLVTVCSACHHVLKRVENDVRTDADFRRKVNNYLGPDSAYEGGTRVVHYLELLRDAVGFDELRRRVVRPLTGQKIGAYYGCLLLRPGAVMAFDDPENPAILESFLRALGAEPVVYPLRNECCGGYVSFEKRALSQRRCGAVMASAQAAGAAMLCTACPLCLYNLENNSPAPALPVVYFTELLAQALGLDIGEGIESCS